jgi:hypothetical protein
MKSIVQVAMRRKIYLDGKKLLRGGKRIAHMVADSLLHCGAVTWKKSTLCSS